MDYRELTLSILLLLCGIGIQSVYSIPTSSPTTSSPSTYYGGFPTLGPFFVQRFELLQQFLL